MGEASTVLEGNSSLMGQAMTGRADVKNYSANALVTITFPLTLEPSAY